MQKEQSAPPALMTEYELTKDSFPHPPGTIPRKDPNWVVLCCEDCGQPFRVCGYRVIPETQRTTCDKAMYIDWLPDDYPRADGFDRGRSTWFPLVERDAKRSRAYHETAAFFAYRYNQECACKLIYRLAHA